MIFLTVGSQLPFDRLVRALDDIAPQLREPVFAQIGKSDLRPVNFKFEHLLTPAAFECRFKEASLIVGHAGIGTVLQALAHRKPLIVYPRRASLGEHRNDHQLATARALQNSGGIHVAMNDQELFGLLTRNGLAAPDPDRRSPLFDRLVDVIREKIDRA